MTNERTLVLKARDWYVFTYLSAEEKGHVLDALLENLNGRPIPDLTEIEQVAFWAVRNAQEERHE
jgi:hypothetical protein